MPSWSGRAPRRGDPEGQRADQLPDHGRAVARLELDAVHAGPAWLGVGQGVEKKRA